MIPAQDQASDLILLAIEDITQRRQIRKELEALNQALVVPNRRGRRLAVKEAVLIGATSTITSSPQAVLDSRPWRSDADMQGRLGVIIICGAEDGRACAA